MKVLIILLVVIFVAQAVTKKEVSDCQSLNVAKQCPDLDSVCQKELDLYNTQKKNLDSCKTANAALSNLQDTDTFPTKDFLKCYSESEPKETNAFLTQFVYEPTIFCAQYGNPYYRGSGNGYKKVNEVYICHAENCDQSKCTKNGAPSQSCKDQLSNYEMEQYNRCKQANMEMENIVKGQVYPFTEVKVTAPFSMLSCNSTISLSSSPSQELKDLITCRLNCAQPIRVPQFSNIINLSLGLLLVALFALL